MNTKALRQKILDLAIRGKLVPPVCRQAGKTLTMNPQPRIEGQDCWFTYVIECEDGSFYKGFTHNLLKRYNEHCKGIGADYTRVHKPKQLYYWEMHYSQEKAIQREKYLKSGVGREWFKREVVDKPESWEPASVLLDRIRAEKARLSADRERLVKEGLPAGKAGKIKRSKKPACRQTGTTSDTPHYEKLPNGWCYTTLGELFTLQAGKNITSSDISNNKTDESQFPCYGGNGLRGYVRLYNRVGRYPLIGRQGALCGNINVADGKFYATEHAVVVDVYDETNIDWAVYSLIQMNLNQYATSTAQPGLAVSTINDIVIALPPSAEQRRIANAISEWMAIIDEIEADKADLEQLIAQTKSKILDLAIRGKLVEQDENDEPASELLKRINPDWQPSDTSHYEQLPMGWTACKLPDIAKLRSGRDLSPSDYNDIGKGIPYITGASNVYKGTILINRWTENAVTISNFGDLLITCKGTVGKLAFNNIGDIHIARQFMAVQFIDSSISSYIGYLLLFKIEEIKKQANSLIPGIDRNVMLNLTFALPPLNEQKRIVAKIEELFATLDSISQALAD